MNSAVPSAVLCVFFPELGCRKWGCNKWGLKGCLAALSGNRPKSAFSPFFCFFRPFPEGAKSTWEIQKTEGKGLFPQISSDLLKPPSLKPPFAALQLRFPGKSVVSCRFLHGKSSLSRCCIFFAGKAKVRGKKSIHHHRGTPLFSVKGIHHRASDPEKEKRRVSTVVVYTFFFPESRLKNCKNLRIWLHLFF